MKILIADDSLVSLKVLERYLKKEHFELVSVRTGSAAWQALQAPDAPPLAILDWMMGDVQGMEVCKRVRAWDSKRRTHLILLTALGGRDDTLAAFAAGVDDYIVKPFDPEILVARVTAAARMVEYQSKLLEEIQYRDRMLQELRSGAAPAAAAAPAKPVAAPAPPTVIATAPKMVVMAGPAQPGASITMEQVLATLCPLAELEALVSSTLAEMGLGDPEPVKDPAEQAAFVPEIGIVHFIIMPDKSAWLDLLLETDRASALALYQMFTGSNDADVPVADLVDVIGETLNLIQGKLKAVFKAKGTELLVPTVPQSIPPEEVPGRVAQNAIHTRHLFKLAGISIRFTLYTYFSPVQRKPLRELHAASVLAEPLRPVDNQDMIIINRGTMLNQRALKKVANLAEFAPRGVTHPVIEPSPLTALLTNL